jgi:hypothetical protein
MSRPFFYCSELSRQDAELPLGTASTGEVWVLLEYSRGWNPRAFEESDLSPIIKRHLSQTIRNIPRARLLFIKQERARLHPLTLMVVRARERDPFIAKFHLESYDELMELDIAAAAAGRMASDVITREPLYLICTHGKRDKCCAKFGYALYKSLHESLGESVWQSSHVGGDRFAANLICFPHGLFYGHVRAEVGQMIVNEYERGRLVLDGYRGRACYGHAVQSAEFFIRQEFGVKEIDALHYLGRHRVNEHSWRVQFATRDHQSIHEAQVTGRLSEFQNYITCHSTEEQKVLQYTLDSYQVIRSVS